MNEVLIKNITDRITRKIIDRINIAEFHDELNKRAKRVVLISPDFYPRVVSPISYGVKRISESLADKGIDTHLIAFDPLKSEVNEEFGGVKIHYIGNKVRSYSPLTWALTISMDVNRKVADIFHNEGPIDLIHSHDWTTFPSGLSLHNVFKRPLMSNFYSLEAQRSSNVHNLYTESVKNLEWKTAQESDKIYVSDEWIKGQIISGYQTPQSKVSVFNPYDSDSFKFVLNDYNVVVRNWFNVING